MTFSTGHKVLIRVHIVNCKCIFVTFPAESRVRVVIPDLIKIKLFFYAKF